MRVIAGSAGGRKLKGPATPATRPMTDRTREAIFNALNSMGVLEGARVVDLFAGTGALGIEALSRGAESCVFVDRERGAVGVIKDNVESIGFGERATVVAGDVLSFVKTPKAFDLAFVAPPYAFEDWPPIFHALDTQVMVCESDKPLDVPAQWRTLRVKKYGQTEITMLGPTA